MHEATEYSSVLNKTEYEPALDYSTSAHKELLIKEQSAALVGHVRVILLKALPTVAILANSATNALLTPTDRLRPPRTSRPSSVIYRNSGSSVALILSPILQTKRQTARKL